MGSGTGLAMGMDPAMSKALGIGPEVGMGAMGMGMEPGMGLGTDPAMEIGMNPAMAMDMDSAIATETGPTGVGMGPDLRPDMRMGPYMGMNGMDGTGGIGPLP
jgi:hypothetical protein